TRPDHAGTSYVREGGFLHDMAEFDADFFGSRKPRCWPTVRRAAPPFSPNLADIPSRTSHATV
ncbi:hypothetical protein, partial [Streptomyces spectabilis]|uniref:hypothetical protein n=1 Tax=Streptomyces spectabilis TaxID=68270 RepID=UPI0033D964EF